MALELMILEGPQAGRRLPMGSAPMVFGRSGTAALSFPLDQFMSGLHMSAQSGPGGIVVNDLRSTNGTFVNEERVSQMVAEPGAIIKIGSLKMQVVSQIAPPAGAVLSSPMVHSPKPGSSVTSTFILPQKNSGVLGALSQVQSPLYCLLDASADQMIPSLLALAAERNDCLYDGDAVAGVPSWAPYLVALKANSPLLRVMVDKGWGKGWASYFTSTSSFEDLQKHFSRFLMVQIEERKEVYFRFYDPRVLREFLPAASSEELAIFYGPVAEWIIEGETPDTLLKAHNTPDGLKMQTVTPTVRLGQTESGRDVPV